MKRFYLSRFIGDGQSFETAFKPKLSRYGSRFGYLDFREDRKKQDGWCVCSLDLEDHMPLEGDSDIVFVTEDPHAPLFPSMRTRFCELLGFSGVASNSLADILIEVLLLSGGLRPDLEGTYELHIGGLVKAFTEDEAMAFLGRLLITNEPFNVNPRRLGQVGPDLERNLQTLSAVLERWAPNWLENKMRGRREAENSHPLVQNFLKAKEDLAADEAIWSHAGHWIRMLVQDLSLVADKIDIRQIVSRLCSNTHCEPTKYELYVMAAYAEAGAVLEKTDTDGLGDFRVRWDTNWTYVECKHKSEETIHSRGINDIFKERTNDLGALMQERKAFSDIRITFSSDPTEDHIAQVLSLLNRELGTDMGNGKRFTEGRNEILILPVQNISPRAAHQGIFVPVGYEYAISQGRKGVDAAGHPIVTDEWRVAWRSLKASGWVTSSVRTFNKAVDQLPKDGPALVYLQVPTGPDEVVTGRMIFLMTRIRDSLMSRQRVNGLVLTGHSLVNDKVSALTRTRYQTLFQKNPRTRLPTDFRVFGHHFTRLKHD